jgi:hypothetical protein
MDITDSSGEKPVWQNQEILLQGAQLEVNGTVCLPARDNTYVVKGTMTTKLQPGASMRLVSGKILYDKPIGLEGEATMQVGDGAVVEIKSDAAKPLVFRIRADGFVYVSGGGQVKTTQGRAVSLPR